ncbi:10505_t:CDS:2 [Ambispora leptoticha]|uniref:10505_t:CDS:1 n=1 Tax=Ambispora leptoticha TaxID=144679 RepID=A0A9N9AJA5_9GLOM|nr:10505_t:CDS:2 [Ambispora leptoticha]
MFILSVFKDTVKIEPQNFRKNKYDAITDELNQKYANKVVQDIGLCICLHDILEAGEEFVHPGIGNGASFVKVKFRLIVFRPFIGEVLVGKIKCCLPTEIKVTMGFFDDIKIPRALLRELTSFQPSEQAYLWKGHGHEYWLDNQDVIKFRVVGEIFTDTAPKQPPGAPRTVAGTGSGGVGVGGPITDTNPSIIIGGNSSRTPPYSIIGSIQEDGLGLPEWWSNIQ